MANRDFQRMDKLLGPPPAPILSAPKKKGGLFSRFKRSKSETFLQEPREDRSSDKSTLSKQELKEYKELKKHKLQLAHKEDELANMERELKNYEKQLKELRDVNYDKDKARRDYEELTGKRGKLESLIKEKEQMLKDLDRQFSSRDKNTSKREKHLAKRESEIENFAEELESERDSIKQELNKLNKERSVQKTREKELAQKEKRLARQQKGLTKSNSQLEHERDRLQNEISKLKHKQGTLKADIHKNKHKYIGKLKSLTKQDAEREYRKEKERLLNERLKFEGDIKALLQKRADLVADVKKAQLDQKKKVSRGIQSLEKQRVRLIESVRTLKPKVKELKQKATGDFYNVEKREKALNARELAFEKREASLNAAQAKLDHLSTTLKQRAFELEKQRNSIGAESNQLDAEQASFKERLNLEQQRFEMAIIEKEALMKNKYQVWEKQLDRRDRALKQSEKKYNREKGKLHLEFEKERAKLAKDIKLERENLYHDLLQQKDHLSKDLVDLETRKREFEHAILEKTETLHDLSETEKLLGQKEEGILKKIEEMKQESQKLKAHEDNVIAKVVDLEKDRDLLDNKENELLEVLKKLDVRESELKGQERELVVRSRDLEHQAKKLEHQRNELDKRLDKVQTNKLLKLNTHALEKKAVRIVGDIEKLGKKKENLLRINQLRREVGTLTSSKKKITSELEKERAALEKEINMLVTKVADMEQFVVAEERLKERQHFVSKKEEALAAEHDRIQTQLNTLEQNSTRALAAASFAHQQKATTQELFDADSREKVEMYAMIEQARDAIIAGKFDLAKQIYVTLQEAYKNYNLSEEERRKVYFEVIELKTDIELGVLA